MNAIETQALSRRFGKTLAVDGLNLRVPKGSVYGFLGPNGAGKTTTIKLLLGLSRPSAGTIRILGEPAHCRKHLGKIGFLPDVPEFYPWMRGDEFLTFAGQLFQLPPQKLRQRRDELLAITGLKGVKTKIGGYSRGMKQRLGLAQALINDPDLIFMDEPTSALDPVGRKELLELIGLVSQRATVFFSTHILTDVERVCDRVGVINQGRLVVEETVAELRRRFTKKVIQLEVAGDSAPMLSELATRPWLQTLRQEHDVIYLTVSDLTSAQQELPKLLVQHGLGLIKMDSLATSLEDIFVELVKS